MKRILAVDDDNAMTEYYKDLFEEAGYQVRTAADATAAVMELREFKPDLLILDAEMPAGGGERVYEITRVLLENGFPILFVTGMPARVEKLARNFNVGIMQKPVKSEELLAVVSGILGGDR